MSNSSTVSSSNIDLGYTVSDWMVKSHICQRDLIIKKIAVTVIALMNFAVLGVALYFIILYCPIPATAILVSPFIGGALGALANMKFPTLGINALNYTNYVNPLALLGRGLAYVFFGPLMFATKHMDWTPYHDPIWADAISEKLETLPFDEIGTLYGKHFSNLAKYGFIQEEAIPDLFNLYNEYKPVKKALEFWQEGSTNNVRLQEAKNQMEKIEEKWVKLRDKISESFPHPPQPDYDFTKLSTRVKLKMRHLCCFGNPIEAVQGFKA